MSDNRDDPSGDDATRLRREQAEQERSRAFQDMLSTLFAAETSSSNGNPGNATISGLNLTNLARVVMGVRGSRRPEIIFRPNSYEIEEDDDNEDEDEDEIDFMDDDDELPSRLTQWYPPHKEPQKAGLDLLASGEFGRVDVKYRARRDNPRRNVTKTILNQFSQGMPVYSRENYQANLVPNTDGTTVATYGANVYTAQFSDDASFYYTCAQDFKLHVFDMRAPEEEQIQSHYDRRRHQYASGLKTRMPLRKVVQGHPGSWTITDANLSPDNERLIYASISPTVYMTSIASDGNSTQIPIPFSDPHTRSSQYYGMGGNFGIWSCRFSADGNEIVAGGSKQIFVYDLLANKRTVKINAHADDVNSCCWADTTSGNVLVSASDDTTLKVWDRRSLGASPKPSGVLMGHTEGLTYVSAKGDGRYIISNGKDQACRLWDLRKMRTNAEFEETVRERRSYGVHHFDYRRPPYPRPRYPAHPKDCSVMTYRGHSVLRTLIRCHFSPGETTGGQYIYSGSADGKVHIWSLDGTVVQVLDRSKTLPASFDADGPEPEPTYGRRSGVCVRDVSWSSKEPVIMSAAWDASNTGTSIAKHHFKGISKLPGALEDWVEKRRLESAEPMSPTMRPRPRGHFYVPGRFESEDDE